MGSLDDKRLWIGIAILIGVVVLGYALWSSGTFTGSRSELAAPAPVIAPSGSPGQATTPQNPDPGDARTERQPKADPHSST